MKKATDVPREKEMLTIEFPAYYKQKDGSYISFEELNEEKKQKIIEKAKEKVLRKLSEKKPV